jgi:hypothetical protein
VDEVIDPDIQHKTEHYQEQVLKNDGDNHTDDLKKDEIVRTIQTI